MVAIVPLFALPDYLLINFSFETIHIKGSAMDPTVSYDDYLIAEKLPYLLHPPRRGDVIIMRDPYDPSRDYIKRVVALPGERVLITDCTVHIDGRALVEPYIEATTAAADCGPRWPPDGPGQTLESDEFFVMGDNRDHSIDSRTFGPVRRRQIESHAWIRILPIERFGPVGGQRAYFCG